MIIATAGHVDHGKTLLVKALTGVDTDRLPEERRRGLTIDLGFAYLALAGHDSIGFIDVPGHEKFIKNALCGLAGTDFVLFIVAADDGPMPQTLEHLAIVDLLGVTHGAVALTKIDRVPPDRVATVTEEIEVLLAGTTLERAPVFALSAMTGDGVGALLDHLVGTAASLPPRLVEHNFRLAVDRTFDVVGSGFVATGTVFSGQVGVGDRVVVPGLDMELRVRGIHAQNAAAECGRAGQRCALNLTGPALRKSLVTRGSWIGGDRVPPPVAKIDTELRVLADSARPLEHWTPVHVHLGAAETTGRIATLEGKRIDPGAQALVQVVLDRPIGAVHGDRFIIRDQSARFTIGGGRVLDIFPPARGRARPERLAWLHAMRGGEAAAALAALLAQSAAGVDLDRFAANRNLTDEEMRALEGQAGIITIEGSGVRHAFSHAAWDAMRAAVVERLRRWHEASPGAAGLGENLVLAGTGIRLPGPTALAIVAALAREGALVRSDMGVHLPGHEARLDPADAKLWGAIGPVIAAAGLLPISVREIAEATGLDWRRVESCLGRAGRLGLVHRISKIRYLEPAAVRQLAETAERLAISAEDGLVGVAAFRDATGVGRNRSVEIMEYFDTKRFTHRIGDSRRVLAPAAKVFGNG